MAEETNKPKSLNDENFEFEISKATGAVLVDFWAEWCGPCKQMNPVLEQLAKDLDGQVTIAKVNVDESPALSQKFGVQSIPTFLVIKNGEVVERKSGVASIDALKALLVA